MFPVALGVIYDDPRPTYEGAVLGQDAVAREGKVANLAKLFAKGQTWACRPRIRGRLAGCRGDLPPAGKGHPPLARRRQLSPLAMFHCPHHLIAPSDDQTDSTLVSPRSSPC
jgi:hypothetical protein